jgi:hypothetical protein
MQALPLPQFDEWPGFETDRAKRLYLEAADPGCMVPERSQAHQSTARGIPIFRQLSPNHSLARLDLDFASLILLRDTSLLEAMSDSFDNLESCRSHSEAQKPQAPDNRAQPHPQTLPQPRAR